MGYDYPVDVEDFVRRAKRHGPEFVRYTGLKDDMREDEKLTSILFNASLGWFPVTYDRKWHGGIDIGLPDLGDDSYFGTVVKAVADGEVVFVEDYLRSSEGFDFGRVILRHTAPSGEEFYVQYRHLDPIKVWPGRRSDRSVGMETSPTWRCQLPR